MSRLLIVLAVLVVCAMALDRPRGDPRLKSHQDRVAKLVEDHPERYWQQKLDHSNPADNRTFAQRYYEVTDWMETPDSPILLYVAGEAPQDHPAGVDDELAVLAKRLGAAVLTPEHRFFGKSAPWSTLTVEHLQYLTVAQELDDLAAFAKWWISQLTGKKHPNVPNKVVAIGGSYSGMIASHVRYAHPEIITAAWSSSGVVEAVLNFQTFDLQIVTSLGQECVETVRRASDRIEELLVESKESNNYVKELFGALGMSDDTLMWMLSDLETLPPQYGHRASLCDPMIAAKNSQQDLVIALATFANNTFYPDYCAGAGPFLYSEKLMQDVDATTPWASQRTWWWLVCSEVAYAQTYPQLADDTAFGVRSPRITLAFHKHICDSVYAPGIWPPNTAAFNKKYGGRTPKATNVVYLNGSQDPWQWCGVRRTIDPSKPAYVVVGPEVGHCKDLHGARSDDPVEVTLARKKAEDFIINALNNA